ncbi:MAG: type 2 isopentenyl-diphosphate Delta-isomerase [Pseudomonadota bacterium]
MSVLTSRKDEHLSIVLERRHKAGRASAGFDDFEFVHCALPDLHLDEIDLSAPFLGRKLAAPFIVSSMTGGPSRASDINRNIAQACQTTGMAMAVGSQRVAIETGGADGGLSSDLRRIAPSIPIVGNIGVAQLNTGFGVDEARRAVDMLEADGLYVHLNPLQEAVQPEGDRDFRGLFDKVVALSNALPVPVLVKEVGNGISAKLAKRFTDAGITYVDVAGAGGTSWAAVEAARISEPADAAVANAFAQWGIPTAQAVQLVRDACPQSTIIASGGVRDGIDAAKAIRLGADIVGQAAGLLDAANENADALTTHLLGLKRALQIVCFCTNSLNLKALRNADITPA